MSTVTKHLVAERIGGSNVVTQGNPDAGPPSPNVRDEEKQSPPPENEKDFIVQFDGDADPDNPRSMSFARKWLITAIVCLCSLCVWVNFHSSVVGRPC